MPKISAPSIVEHRELRRQQLISAALELALGEGAEAVTVAAVAKKAGLARSSIYEYFASSADLIADLILEELDYYSNRLAIAIIDATDPFEKIEHWIAEGLRYVADGRHMLVKSLNTISTPEFRKEEIAMGHRKMIAPLRQALVETGIKDPAAAAAFLSSVTDAASIRIDAGNDAELEIQRASTFALAGLRALATN
ncbi:MAG: TetR/AcrR family transcriptional regulator [Actinomycetes bacterium]|jgi:AcrR family transcriptional regulator